MNDLKIDIYVLHWNEEKITKFMMDYWDKLPVRKLFVIDNESDDNSLSLLKERFGEKLQVFTYSSEGTFNDFNHMNIKNQLWKNQSKGQVDFVIISDFDEQIWCENLIEQLQYMKENNIDIVKPIGVDIYFEKFPEYDSTKVLHEYSDAKFILGERIGKCILFNPNNITEINYDAGAHNCFPVGNYRWYNGPVKFYYLHFKQLSADYMIERNHTLAKRLSEINIRRKWGFHYMQSEEQIRTKFNQNLSNCVDSLDKI
jgi:hypothetical protein